MLDLKFMLEKCYILEAKHKCKLSPTPLMAPNAAPIKSLANEKSDVGLNRNL